MVSVNGEDVVHCDSVVKEALSKFWGVNDWHFVRRSSNVKSYVVSQVVDGLVSKKPKLLIMNNN